jgi:putative IMPACT (imprinted ancient) family translation regulator
MTKGKAMKTKKKKKNLLPVILFSGVILLSIGGLILAENLRQARIENPGEITTQDDVPRVTVQEAYQAQQESGAVILDTRSEAEFQSQHVAGAINIPVNQIEGRLGELDPEIWYITYCT